MSYFVNFPAPIGTKNVGGVDSYVAYTSEDGLNGIKVTMMNGVVKTSDYASTANFASKTIAIGAPTVSIILEAKTAGVDGNQIALEVLVAGLNTVASISESGSHITVNSATDGAGVATTTATEVKALIDGDSASSALVTVTLGNVDGSTVVGAITETSLLGGTADNSETTRDTEMNRLDGLLMLGA